MRPSISTPERKSMMSVPSDVDPFHIMLLLGGGQTIFTRVPLILMILRTVSVPSVLRS